MCWKCLVCINILNAQFQASYLLKAVSLQLMMGLGLGLIARSGCAKDSVLKDAALPSFNSLPSISLSCF